MKLNVFIRGTSSDTDSTFLLKNIIYLSKVKIDRAVARGIVDNFKLDSFKRLAKVFSVLGISAKAIQADLNDLIGIDNLLVIRLGDRFVLANGITDTSINILHAMDGWKKTGRASLDISGRQAVFVLETTMRSGLSRYLLTLIRNHPFFAIVLTALFIGVILVSFFPNWLVRFLAVLGLVFSSIATWETISGGTPISFCELGSGSGCQTVLRSRHGKILGVPLGSIALFYFIFVFLTIFSGLPDALSMVCFMSGLALMASFYFIIIQSFVLRNYCVICIGIIAVNLFMAGTTLFLVPQDFLNDIGRGEEIVPMIISFAFSVLGAFALSRHFYFRSALLRAEHELKKYRRSFPFEAKLRSSPRLLYPYHHPSEIFFGKSEAVIRLDLFISFQCEACRKALHDADLLCKINPEIKVVVNFVPARDTRSIRFLDTLLTTRVVEGNASCQSILRTFSVSEKITKRKTIENYTAITECREYYVQLSQLNHINPVPVVAFDGYLLDKSFGIADIKYFASNFSQREFAEERHLI